MLDTQLVLVEGMAGAGKSTTAQRVAERLREAGLEARSYHEFDDDNPIRTKASDAMKAGYEKEGPLEIPAGGGPGEANPYGSHQWRTLAEELVTTPKRVVVLESRYWQNALWARFLNGWDEQKLLAYQQRICEYAAPARPALVWLDHDDPASVMERVYPERTPEWRRWMERNISDSVWCRERGLTGSEAVFQNYLAWEPIAEKLFSAHAPHKLRLENPAADWQASMLRLAGFLAS